jgi:SAM-dependent methyltransferase
MLGGALERLYRTAVALNRRNIIDLVHDRPYGALCDLGCDDGEWTSELARFSRSQTIVGLEIDAERAQIAISRGIRVIVSDLTRGFPFTDGSFDLVHANQVIEHVSDVDHFLAEVKRVLRVGGVAVISTENGSSWHNVVAAAMGWQIFSLTNVSAKTRSVGNPLALHRRGPIVPASWTHKTIFNYRGLLDLVEAHGLTVLRAVGAGYHPLPAGFGRLDVRHSHFITVKAVKGLASHSATTPADGSNLDPASAPSSRI